MLGGEALGDASGISIFGCCDGCGLAEGDGTSFFSGEGAGRGFAGLS